MESSRFPTRNSRLWWIISMRSCCTIAGRRGGLKHRCENPSRAPGFQAWCLIPGLRSKPSISLPIKWEYGFSWRVCESVQHRQPCLGPSLLVPMRTRAGLIANLRLANEADLCHPVRTLLTFATQSGPCVPCPVLVGWVQGWLRWPEGSDPLLDGAGPLPRGVWAGVDGHA